MIIISSKYGLKIKNYQAGSIYGVDIGIRNRYDTKDAMFTKSLFYNYITNYEENGKKLFTIYKDTSTRDIICIQFDYGTRSYEEEIKYINKKIKDLEKKLDDEKANIESINKDIKYWEYLRDTAEGNKDKFRKISKQKLRELYYVDGVDIKYPVFKKKEIIGYETIHYKMLYRTPGKAKKGSCMFIREELYDIAHNFLWMGLELPEENAPIVEIGAYSSLITSTIEANEEGGGIVKIDPDEILIVPDVDSYFRTNIVSVELDEHKRCVAKDINNYELKNTMFDGQALIDESIFPSWGDGYILLRQHFCKMAAFHTKIQKYFREYYGDEYETAEVTDMWGRKLQAKKIKLITTENAIKWTKFGVDYEYWSKWVRDLDCSFGIVKTAHSSKLGDVQRMSYQMVNSLAEESMDSVLKKSLDYVYRLKTDISEYLNYLEKNSNFSNDYDVLAALYRHNPEFERCDYFRVRKKEILRQYLLNLKNGRLIQNADNLVIVGSPFAMLLHAVGEDPLSDPTFEPEEGCIQCWTGRFKDGEYLAEFRNPFNSRNNLGYLHNHYHEYWDRYFKLGDLIVAVNMNGTDMQDRNNGSDQDSDSIYTTNQPDIVEHAKYCYSHYPTIVNNIPKEKNEYSKSLLSFAQIDNNLSASQTDIGESSNLAQVCLTYTYNFNDPKIQDYVCILSVLAQLGQLTVM